MATDQALRGLDQLELEPETSGAGSDWPRLARKAWNTAWPKLLAIAIVLALWQLVIEFHYKPLVIKGPVPTLTDLWHMAQHGMLWSTIGWTMRSAVEGYAVALILGSAVGLIVARVPILRSGVGSIITGLQTMPSVAWAPFGIIIFGENNSAIMFVVILGAAPSIANGLIAGIDYTPPLLLRAGRTMGLRGYALYRYLILPASLPSYVAGLKQGWAFAWRSLMAAELFVAIIGQFSIGQQLNVDQQDADFKGAGVMIIVILIIGVIIDTIFTKIDITIRRRRGLLDASAP